MPRPPADPAITEAARQLVASGLSNRQAAEKLAADHGVTVDQRTIGRWTADTARPRGRRPRADVDSDAVTAALADGRSYAGVAGELGVSKSTAWRRAHRDPEAK
jgi:transposase